PSTQRSRSSASSSSSSPPRRPSRSCSRGKEQSRSSARRWARRTRRSPHRARSAATSRSRCRTTSCTAPTRPSRPPARSRCGSAMSSSEPDSVAVNRAVWTRSNAEYTDAQAAGAWARDDLLWGVWHRPESELRVLPDDVAGLDVIELGCGTAYMSAWFARHGARVVGVDPTPAQLETARRLQGETGIEFRLVEAPGEAVPLPDESADLVVSEYGASIWADPALWIPEAARM